MKKLMIYEAASIVLMVVASLIFYSAGGGRNNDHQDFLTMFFLIFIAESVIFLLFNLWIIAMVNGLGTWVTFLLWAPSQSLARLLFCSVCLIFCVLILNYFSVEYARKNQLSKMKTDVSLYLTASVQIIFMILFRVYVLS